MKNVENGVVFGSKHVPDELIVRMSWLLPATIVPLSMVIHLLSGNSRDFPFFISEADFPGIERWVFTTGLAISGLIQILFAYRVWYRYKGTESPRLLFVFLLCGIFVGSNLFVMAFANMYDHLKLHVATASIVFQLGIVWAMLSHFVIWKQQTREKTANLCHLNLYYFLYCHVTSSGKEQLQDLKTMDWKMIRYLPSTEYNTPWMLQHMLNMRYSLP